MYTVPEMLQATPCDAQHPAPYVAACYPRVSQVVDLLGARRPNRPRQYGLNASVADRHCARYC